MARDGERRLRTSRRFRVLAAACAVVGVIVVAAVAALVAATQRAGARLEEVSAGLSEASPASDDERLAAGRRILENAAGRRASPGDQASRRWTGAVAIATDEQFPEPTPELASWFASEGPALAATARLATQGPVPAWERSSFGDASILSGDLARAAACSLASSDHAAAEAFLEAAWILRESRDMPLDSGWLMLGVLRSTRVGDPPAWLARLQSLTPREDERGAVLLAARRHWRAALSEDAEVKPWPRGWTGILEPIAARAGRWRERFDAGWYASVVLRESAALQAVDPCVPVTSAIGPSWRRHRLVAAVLPYRPAALQAAQQLARYEESEVTLRLTQAVLRVRASLPADPCGLIDHVRQADGRVTLRWSAEKHPVAEEPHAGVREFTFTPVRDPHAPSPSR